MEPQHGKLGEASTTDLAGMFGSTSPPLPAGGISRWALYLLAFFPLCGLLIQGLVSSLTNDPVETYSNHAWILFYIAANGLLGWLDERNLERAGLQLKGATIISALLVPVYVYLSCRTYKRHTEAATWAAYAPIFFWIAAFLLEVSAPDTWFQA